MLYEIVFRIGEIDTPFSIYTMRPRRHINDNCKINEIVPISQTLVVEESETAVDPMTFLSNEPAIATQLKIETVCECSYGELTIILSTCFTTHIGRGKWQ